MLKFLLMSCLRVQELVTRKVPLKCLRFFVVKIALGTVKKFKLLQNREKGRSRHLFTISSALRYSFDDSKQIINKELYNA